MTPNTFLLYRKFSHSALELEQAILDDSKVLNTLTPSEWPSKLSQINDLSTTDAPYRMSLIASTPEELTQKMQQAIETPKVPASQKKIGFLFTGQGAQRPHMARTLYHNCENFRQTIDLCNDILTNQYNIPLLDLLTSDKPEVLEQLDQTGNTQPVLFAYEYALAMLWKSLGVIPDAVIGHSVGEFAAATYAGMLSLEDGLKMISHRAQLMQGLPHGGSMMAMLTDAKQVTDLLSTQSDHIDFAAINTPKQTVVSGKTSALSALAKYARTKRIKAIPLAVSHAFHSHLMEPMLNPFHAIASQVTHHPPHIGVVSNVTGQLVTTPLSADYWIDHVRKPVLFADGLNSLIEYGCSTFVEIGPQPILATMGEKTHGSTGEYHWLPSAKKGENALLTLLSTLCSLDQNYANLDWKQASALAALPIVS